MSTHLNRTRILGWLGRVMLDVPSRTFMVAYAIASPIAAMRGKAFAGSFDVSSHSMSKPVVIRAIALLEARGWIAVDRTTGIKNMYTLLRMEEAAS